MIVHDDELVTLHLGDCVEVMRELPAESVDAIVTDPPYNLSFMGRAWDKDHQHEPWAREAFRVAKPGAHLLAFGGTRTYHRLASAIEDAGWEIRDCLVWAYASGFPKSLDVSKAIDKSNGHWRGRAGAVTVPVQASKGTEYVRTPKGDPIAAEAVQWDGWGTALKPAWEPIVMARKPLRGTVAQNVLAHGTGALNIDATRIGTTDELSLHGRSATENGWDPRMSGEQQPGPGAGQQLGRWPPNLLLTSPIFDGDTPGVVGGGSSIPHGTFGGDPARATGYEQPGWGSIADGHGDLYGDSGTYSRFFLIPKSSRSDREPLVGQVSASPDRANGGSFGHKRCATCGKQEVNMPGSECQCDEPVWVAVTETRKRANNHPTVKPLDLMRHLVRLVTPPGGTVLDPFLGSGTTAIAANAEGFRCIGIEREREYLDIAVARMAHQPLGLGLDVEAPTRRRVLPSDEKLAELAKTYRMGNAGYRGGWSGEK